MLSTSLNIVKASSGWGWAGGYFWHLKEVMVASGRFTVLGSGDGNARFAYNGSTAALPALEQGSGGGFDCWQSPKFTDMTTPQAGYTNASAWVVMQETGTARQYLFVVTNQTAAGWDGYGRIAYNAGGGATPAFVGAAATATVLPGASTNEQWFFSSARGSPNGVVIAMLTTASGYVHLFCDDAQENGATSFGWISASDSRAVGGFIACPTIGGPTWDPDCLIFISGTTLTSVQTWNQLGFGGAAWLTATVNTRSAYTGAAATRDTDGTALIVPVGITSGAGAAAYFKGYTGRAVGYAQAKWLYPTLVQSDAGDRMIPAASGMMLRWPEANPVILPR